MEWKREDGSEIQEAPEKRRNGVYLVNWSMNRKKTGGRTEI